MDRSERCDFFSWADNTSNAAIDAYNMKKSGGVNSREDDRMASYIRRWNTMSTAELKVVLKRKKLAVSGKKSVLLERLKDAFRVQGDHVDQALGLQAYRQQDSKDRYITEKNGAKDDDQGGEDVGDAADDDNDDDDDDDDDDDNMLIIGDVDGKDNQQENDSAFFPSTARSTHMKKAERVLKQVFQFKYFRPSQKWAIDRLLQQKSTLVVASTGSGKSLIYQIPSFLLPGMTLVISPLLSLIQDQMDSLPAALPGACLTSNMTAEETGHVLRDLRDRRVKVLFVSPERLFSSSFQRLMRTNGALPEISLVC